MAAARIPPKGYLRADLHDAWSRYLPQSPATSATSATSATVVPFGSCQRWCVSGRRHAERKGGTKSAIYNAAVRRQQAAAERDDAAAEGQDYYRRNMRQVASGRAMRGATGVTMEGSPLLGDEATVAEGRWVHRGSCMTALRRGQGLSRRRACTTCAASTPRTGSYLEAGASLLSGSSKAFEMGRRV